MAGKFISFEGPDGAGKTSVLNALVAELRPTLGDQLVVTREPGGDHFSEKLRQTAALRMENPELSLAELAAIAEPPVTKSCLNHRLRRLIEISREN